MNIYNEINKDRVVFQTNCQCNTPINVSMSFDRIDVIRNSPSTRDSRFVIKLSSNLGFVYIKNVSSVVHEDSCIGCVSKIMVTDSETTYCVGTIVTSSPFKII